MTVGERIRAARKAKGLTQKELGEACGIAEPTIRRYELGKLNPKFETLQKIAKPLGLPVANLCGIEPLPDDFLFYLEEKYIRFEIPDKEEREKELEILEQAKEKGLTWEQRAQMEDPFSEVFGLMEKLGLTGYTEEDFPPPDGYDAESYFVCKNERNGNFYICSVESIGNLVRETQDYALIKLKEFFESSIPYTPQSSPPNLHTFDSDNEK